MRINTVPRPYAQLVELAVKAQAGVEIHGITIGLLHHSGAAIAADLYDLTGNPDTPLAPGKQAILNACNQAIKSTRVGLQDAKASGQEFCRMGIALLKAILGTSYNAEWDVAGFQARTLRVPRDPVPMLIEFRQYFEANPAHENALIGITAVKAHAAMAAIRWAQSAVASASTARLLAKAARDAAQRKLHKRISGVRAELAQLLNKNDGAWLKFGFRRPGEGRIPEPVEDLQLTAGTPGTVIAAWDSSSRAENYRVTWRRADTADVIEVGLFADRRLLLSGLPSGVTVIVAVSARNGSGETRATERTITVP